MGAGAAALFNDCVAQRIFDPVSYTHLDVYKRQDTDCLRMVFLYLISKGCENTEKSLEQLKQEYEKNTVLLEREKRKMQRLKNRQAYLESCLLYTSLHRIAWPIVCN